MKKALLMLACCGFVISALAQRDYYYDRILPSGLASKTPTDTLWPGNAQNASAYALIADSNGGYVLGTNSYGDIAKAQHFIVDSGYTIEGAIFWFANKTAVSSDSIRFVLWKMDSLHGFTTAGVDQPSPGTELAAVNYCIQDVDTASNIENAFVANFPQAVNVYEDYFLGFDFSALALADTIALWSTSNGDGLGNELVWEQWGIDSTWHTLQASGWGFPALLDVDAMILPIVDMTSAGIHNVYAFSEITLAVSPNPAVNEIHLCIQMQIAIENAAIRLLDINGRSVLEMKGIDLLPGTNELTLNVSSFAAGTYYLCLFAGNAPFAVQVVITKKY